MHRGAHDRLPLASDTHTADDSQHTAPQARPSAQHAPPTHVCPLGHAPVGFDGLHAAGIPARQLDPEQVCPIAHWLPQAPQLLGSLDRSTQPVAQAVVPSKHVEPPHELPRHGVESGPHATSAANTSAASHRNEPLM